MRRPGRIKASKHCKTLLVFYGIEDLLETTMGKNYSSPIDQRQLVKFFQVAADVFYAKFLHSFFVINFSLHFAYVYFSHVITTVFNYCLPFFLRVFSPYYFQPMRVAQGILQFLF